MTQHFLFGLSALIALLLPALSASRTEQGRDGLYWLLLGVGIAGPLAWAFTLVSQHWQTSFSAALWVTIAASALIFGITTLFFAQAWRLTALLFPYLFGLGVFALIWQSAQGKPMAEETAEISRWVVVHIGVSIATYGLATIAAMAALGAFIVERALKTKKPTKLSRMLPSVADGESLLVNLLTSCETVLALGLLSGIGLLYLETGKFLALDHKTLFSIGAFIVIGALLGAHHLTGVRGRKATRLVLVAYLLLSLGFVGVKFVTDVMMN